MIDERIEIDVQAVLRMPGAGRNGDQETGLVYCSGVVGFFEESQVEIGNRIAPNVPRDVPEI